MRVVITGGGGFLGLKLAKALLARDAIAGSGAVKAPLSKLVLLDAAYPDDMPSDARLEAVRGDVADAATLDRVLTADTDSVFHLAAVVSGAAEADFDLGDRVNLEGTRRLLERARRCTRPPRLVFASSVAAFGGVLPPVLDDSTTPTPQTSYGTQKVIGEYLIADMSRKGFIDGRSLREPLNGVASACPVAAETGVWLLSPKRVIEAFLHAHDLPASAWPSTRTVNLPGITVSVAEMLEGLRRVAGDSVVRRVRFEPDARIQAIVKTWPARLNTPRALDMGFRADPDIDTVIRDYIADEKIKAAE
jgi:nucleoside-diphosphate-sugar epimerase